MTGKKRKFSMIEWLVLLIAGSVFVLSAWQLGKWWYAGQVSDRVTKKLVAEAVEIRQDAEKTCRIRVYRVKAQKQREISLQGKHCRLS